MNNNHMPITATTDKPYLRPAKEAPMSKLPHLFFLIRSLGHGGSERQLIELVKALDTTSFRITVATFYDGGLLRSEMEALPGVSVLSFGKRSRWDVLSLLWRVFRTVRQERPDILWAYIGIAYELVALLGLVLRVRVVWGLGMSETDQSREGWATVASFRLCAWMSRLTDLMIANSYSGMCHYAKEGYASERLAVVSNGIDTDRFQPNQVARVRIRASWSVSESELLIGMVGRLDPQKDHPTFLRAAAILASQNPTIRFVCVGDGPSVYRQRLMQLAHELGLADRLIWIRSSNDMPDIYNAFDLATLPSAYGEGFANVVGEAMSCGIPVVATDVGDSAFVVDNPEQIVPRNDPVALAAAWERYFKMSSEEKVTISRKGRERIVSEFGIAQLRDRTIALIQGIR
ncbi:MAG: mtfB 2 [Chthoniobacteraceae bacterium]|nr:mtfB 2 [Chthoniobacteraceae bacterium]